MSVPLPESNPYAPPVATLGTLPEDSTEAESARRAYLKRELAIKGIGSFDLFAAFYTWYGALIMLMSATRGLGPEGSLFWLSLTWFGLTAFFFALGFGLRRLRPWARWVHVALFALVWLSLPFSGLWASLYRDGLTTGTNSLSFAALLGFLAVFGYLLYLLVSGRAGVVFSAEHQRVIAATPHMTSKIGPLVSAIVKGGFTLMCLFTLMALLGSFVNR